MMVEVKDGWFESRAGRIIIDTINLSVTHLEIRLCEGASISNFSDYFLLHLLN